MDDNMEFIEKIGGNVRKGKSPPNMKGMNGRKVPTKAELKDMSSPDLHTLADVYDVPSADFEDTREDIFSVKTQLKKQQLKKRDITTLEQVTFEFDTSPSSTYNVNDFGNNYTITTMRPVGTSSNRSHTSPRNVVHSSQTVESPSTQLNFGFDDDGVTKKVLSSSSNRSHASPREVVQSSHALNKIFNW